MHKKQRKGKSKSLFSKSLLVRYKPYLAGTVLLVLLFALAGYAFATNRTPNRSEADVPKSNLASRQNTAVDPFQTSYPATPAQTECNQRLEMERSSIPVTVYCGATGKYVATKANGEKYFYVVSQANNTEVGSSAQSIQPVKEDKSKICEFNFQTLYRNPVDKLGRPPTSAHIVRYIGTDEYEYQVNQYNQKAKEYNNAVSIYKASYLRLAHSDGCDTSFYESLMSGDYAQPYSG